MKLILIILISIYAFSIEIQKPNIYEKDKHKVNNWLMSEKLDGIRAYWDGKNLISKNGNIINAPNWFTKNFPNFELDGELWTKRADFENIQNIVLDATPTDKWKEITYNIFEIPNEKGNFSERMAILNSWLNKNPNSYIKIIPQIVCKNENHLNNYLNELIDKKAEGIILKNPNINYEKGRTNNLLKVKTFFDDEGVVIGHNFDENKRLKSLIIKLKDETIFNLGGGFTELERVNPPKIDDIVTFKYYGFTKNKKPKFASFLRIRKIE